MVSNKKNYYFRWATSFLAMKTVTHTLDNNYFLFVDRHKCDFSPLKPGKQGKISLKNA